MMMKSELDALVLGVLKTASKPLTTGAIVTALRSAGHSIVTAQHVTQSLYQRLAKSGMVRIEDFKAQFVPDHAPEPEASESALRSAILELASRAVAECGYGLDTIRERMALQGPLEAIRDLLSNDYLSEDFLQLWSRNRLDLTVESMLLQTPWCALLSEEQLAVAQRRLAQPDPSDVLHALAGPQDDNRELDPSELQRKVERVLIEARSLSKPCQRAGLTAEYIRTFGVESSNLADDVLAAHVLSGCTDCTSYSELIPWAMRRNQALRSNVGQLARWAAVNWERQPSDHVLESFVWRRMDFLVGLDNFPSPEEKTEAFSECASDMLAGFQEMLAWRMVLVMVAIGTLCERLRSLLAGADSNATSLATPTWGMAEDSGGGVLSESETDMLRVGSICRRILCASSQWSPFTGAGKVEVPSLGDPPVATDILDWVEPSPDDRDPWPMPDPPIELDWRLFLDTIRRAAKMGADAESVVHEKQSTRPPVQAPREELAATIDRLEALGPKLEALLGSTVVEPPEASLRAAMSAQVFDSLVPEARSSVVASEQVLRVAAIADPNLIVTALARGFEAQLKAVFLDGLQSFLVREYRLREYPDRDQCATWRTKQILRGGRLADKLMLGETGQVLDLRLPEVLEFCARRGFDLDLLCSEIRTVSQIRGKFVHDVPRNIAAAKQYRDQLIGVGRNPGGVFRALLGTAEEGGTPRIQ